MRLFAVVGMHRSGTSNAARAVGMVGAHLGSESDLMPPKPDNPRGFWELQSVVALHDDLLSTLGGSWMSPPRLPDGWEEAPALDGFVRRIRQLVDSHFSGASIAAWKDPRGSFLLPIWRRVVPIAGTIVCLRHPDEVAESLRARNGFGDEQTAALWLEYVAAAFRNDGAALIVRFEDAFEKPRELTSRLAGFIGAPEGAGEASAEFETYVESELRHNRARQETAGPRLRLARAVYGLIAAAPRDVVLTFLSLLRDRRELELLVQSHTQSHGELRDVLRAWGARG